MDDASGRRARPIRCHPPARRTRAEVQIYDGGVAMGCGSLKDERWLVEIAASAKSYDQIVDRTNRAPRAIRKAVLRLGMNSGATTSDAQLAVRLWMQAK
jgi:hypothetical protein